jgi:2-polyprenyl-3-methyl-5-hydroxy-6-metoxy-1,4-benzoquinol methylase
MLKQNFTQCPLCSGPLDRCEQHRTGDTTGHVLYKPELPAPLHWLRCAICGHVFTQDYWTTEGEQVVFGSAQASQLPGTNSEYLRNQWAPTVHRVANRLSETRGREAVFAATGVQRPIWLDVGFGNGGLVMTADEFGFATIGVDVRTQAVELLQSLGYRAICAHFEELALGEAVTVLSMCDVLEHVRDPHSALAKAHAMLSDQGLIYISCPNSETSTWRQWEQTNTNPYWGEIEHYHNFSREKLFELLGQHGFSVVDYYSCMEITARKQSVS